MAMTLEFSHQPMHPIFIPEWRGLHSAISSFRPLHSSFPRRRESRGEVRVVAMTLEFSHQPMHPIFIPWCAGRSRHERLL